MDLSLRGTYYLAISGLTKILGLRGAEFLAGLLSTVRYLGNRRMAGVYLGHLSRIFPRMSRAQLRRVLKGYWRVHQRALLGLFYSSRFSSDNIDGLVRWENMDILEEAVSEGKGVLLLVPHFGDERTLHILLAISGYDMHVISSRYTDAPEILRKARLNVSRKWHHVAFPDEPIRWAYDAVKRGEVIQISPTGWGGSKGHWVKSFGVPVLASSTPVRLARSTGCRLLTAYNRVLPGMKYHIAFHRFDPESLDLNGTGQLFERFESIAKQYPEQYNWMNLVIRHRETNTIAGLGYIPREESIVEAAAVHADWDPTNIKDLQTISSISALSPAIRDE